MSKTTPQQSQQPKQHSPISDLTRYASLALPKNQKWLEVGINANEVLTAHQHGPCSRKQSWPFEAGLRHRFRWRGWRFPARKMGSFPAGLTSQSARHIVRKVGTSETGPPS